MSNDESESAMERDSKTLDQFRRITLDLIWLAPGIIALAPYFMRPPSNLSVVDQLAYLFGVYGWLFSNPLHLIIAAPSVVYIVHWIRTGGRYVR